MAVFVTISAAVFAAFRCDMHANGISTVQSLSQVVCWADGQHREIVIVGLIGSMSPLAFLSHSTGIMDRGRQSSSRFVVQPGEKASRPRVVYGQLINVVGRVTIDLEWDHVHSTR